MKINFLIKMMNSVLPVKSNLAYYKIARKVIEQYIPARKTATSNNHATPFLPQFRALTAWSPSVVCVIDITKKDYLYVSNNIYNQLGYLPDEFYKEGFLKTISLFPPHQLEIVLEKIFPLMFSTLEEFSLAGNAENLKISYCTLFNHKDGTQRWYLHQITVFASDENGKAHLLIKQVTDIHEFKTDQSIVMTITIIDKNGIFQTILKKEFIAGNAVSPLSGREIEILQLMGQGFSSKEIAETLFLSEHTVYKHRKNMLKKMDVKRTGDLLKKAIGTGII